MFYVFSSGAIISSYCTITITNSVYAIFFLVLTFLNSSGILLLLGMEFFSILFLIVYVGAIAVLFLFVIMILNLKDIEEISQKYFEFIPISIFLFFFFILEIFFIFEYTFIPSVEGNYVYFIWIEYFDKVSSINYFGQSLYTYYIYYFLLSGVILLLAIISAISLTRVNTKDNNLKYQLVYEQISRRESKAIFRVKLKDNGEYF